MRTKGEIRRIFPFILVITLLLIGSLHLPETDNKVVESSRDGSGTAQQVGGTNSSVDPFASFRFVRNSQNIEANRLNSLSDIHYYVRILNGTGYLSGINASERSNMIKTVRSFQNADGGFGDWYRDRSKAGSTRRALETLTMLNSTPANATAAVRFLERLQVSGLEFGNHGFRSSIKERDADITSTFNALRALELLGSPIPNRTQVVFYVKDHQNYDGGFGYQTNRESDIEWPSTIVHTVRGLQAVRILGVGLDFEDEAVDYVTGLQSTEGGFANTESGSPRVSYTHNALISLDILGEAASRTDDIEDFILNNQLPSGGFLEHALDNQEGIHTAAFAVDALGMLGATYDGSDVVSFAEKFIGSRIDGGFGEYPGISSTLRVTFDAVSMLNIIGRTPADPQSAADFVLTLKNSDGGFGANGLSNVESTFRAVLTLQVLGISLDDPTATVDYIRSCQNEDGGFGFADGYVSRGAYTYRAVRVLDVLGSRPLNRQGAISFLRSLQNADGGFGNYFGEGDSDLGSTYRAVRGLTILGGSPTDMDLTEDWILDSQNPDGGFRRSPTDLTAPNNFSRSYYTYDAILSLQRMGRPLDDDGAAKAHVGLLRNPDLGYGTNPFFTSQVSSTFTSVWALFNLDPSLNNAPVLFNASAAQEGNVTGSTRFSVVYTDAEGQAPEYVHLVLDGVRHLMDHSSTNGTELTFTTTRRLSVGNHNYSFSTTDGLSSTTTNTSTTTITATDGSAPSISLFSDAMEGTTETEFTLTAIYFDPDGDPPEYVNLSILGGAASQMTITGDTITLTRTLPAGEIELIAETSDGVNLASSDVVHLTVHPRTADRPDWDTFLIIRKTILDTYGAEVDYLDVSLSQSGSDLAWIVNVGDRDVIVSYDGTKLLDKEEEDDSSGRYYFILALVIIVAIYILLIHVRQNESEEITSEVRRRPDKGRTSPDDWLEADDNGRSSK